MGNDEICNNKITKLNQYFYMTFRRGNFEI